MSRADVSVVICAYDWERRETLRAAVDSVRSQTSETIVVTDHAPELHRWAQSLDARVIASDRTPGLAGARNAGVEAARHPIVAFLDDDAVAAPDWVARLTPHFADPDVVGAGGAILPRWTADRPDWFPGEFDWVVGCTYTGLPGVVAPVRNLIGCNMSFRRDAVLAAGGFADGLGRIGRTPVGCEETDLCLRLSGRLIYDPRAVVHHHVTRERATLRYFVARCYGEGRSKRAVVGRAGADRGLASERTHLLRVLPAAVGRGLRTGAVARAGAIALGVAAAGAGYATGGRR